ncbi:MAG: SDR family oxidoreductase [Chloroflexota bacterium]|nr:SDR family oxidoreductase [Chloroflexota bacterium]
MHDTTMTGKVAVITGASQGIGKETALGLARMGATVGMVARDEARGRAAVEDVKAITGNGNVYLFLADLSSQEQIRRLAKEIGASFVRLDVLVNNAGALNLQRTVTMDGIETTFAVDHLAYFLLTALLLPMLESSAPSRIVNVASDAANGATIDFADLQGERKYSGWGAYGQSKLANILFTYELARRIEGTGVTANVLHPGVISSGFNRNNGFLMRLGMKAVSPFLAKPDKGAETSLYLATSPEVAGVSGKYFARCREATSPPVSHDETIARELWEVSERMTA